MSIRHSINHWTSRAPHFHNFPIFHTHGQTSAAVSAVRNDLHWILSLCQIPAAFLPQTIQDGSLIRIDTQILMYNVQFPSSWTPHGQLITVGSWSWIRICSRNDLAKRSSTALVASAAIASHRCRSGDPSTCPETTVQILGAGAKVKERAARTTLLGNSGSCGCGRSKTTYQFSDP